MQLTLRNRPKVNRCLSGVKDSLQVALRNEDLRRKSDYMLEHLSIRSYVKVIIVSVQTISREDCKKLQNPQRLYVRIHANE